MFSRKIMRFDALGGAKGKIALIHYLATGSEGADEIVFTAIPSDGETAVSIITGDNLTQIVMTIVRQELAGIRGTVSFYELRTSVSHRNMFSRGGYDIITVTVPAHHGFPVRYSTFAPIPFHLPFQHDFADIIDNTEATSGMNRAGHALVVIRECLNTLPSRATSP